MLFKQINDSTLQPRFRTLSGWPAGRTTRASPRATTTDGAAGCSGHFRLPECPFSMNNTFRLQKGAFLLHTLLFATSAFIKQNYAPIRKNFNGIPLSVLYFLFCNKWPRVSESGKGPLPRRIPTIKIHLKDQCDTYCTTEGLDVLQNIVLALWTDAFLDMWDPLTEWLLLEHTYEQQIPHALCTTESCKGLTYKLGWII